MRAARSTPWRWWQRRYARPLVQLQREVEAPGPFTACKHEHARGRLERQPVEGVLHGGALVYERVERCVWRLAATLVALGVLPCGQSTRLGAAIFGEFARITVQDSLHILKGRGVSGQARIPFGVLLQTNRMRPASQRGAVLGEERTLSAFAMHAAAGDDVEDVLHAGACSDHHCTLA